jgi:hypothetical protein
MDGPNKSGHDGKTIESPESIVMAGLVPAIHESCGDM